MKTFIVVAAYNEEQRIGGVVHDLRGHGYTNIIVVDDCSADKTGKIARKLDVQVLRHRKNRGQGAALRTGIRQALNQGADIIVTFDGDGQHQASEIKRLIRPIQLGRVDVVLGSRFMGGAIGLPWYKWILLKGSILVERLFLGIKLTDVHNGFRAFSRRAASYIKITFDGMAHGSEIVAEIHDLGLRYTEVPVTILYDEYTRQHGQSVFNAFNILGKILEIRKRRAI